MDWVAITKATPAAFGHSINDWIVANVQGGPAQVVQAQRPFRLRTANASRRICADPGEVL